MKSLVYSRRDETAVFLEKTMPITKNPKSKTEPGIGTERLRAKDVAEILGVSLVTVHRWLHAGDLCPPIRDITRKGLYWLREDIDAWVGDGGCQSVLLSDANSWCEARGLAFKRIGFRKELSEELQELWKQSGHLAKDRSIPIRLRIEIIQGCFGFSLLNGVGQLTVRDDPLVQACYAKIMDYLFKLPSDLSLLDTLEELAQKHGAFDDDGVDA